jgi:hypothetical protein
MRGIVYRPGRRRTGSVLLALGVALTFAVGSAPVALAKAKAPAHITAKHLPVAHAAGHKIA